MAPLRFVDGDSAGGRWPALFRLKCFAPLIKWGGLACKYFARKIAL